MIVFEVTRNGERLCLAGADDLGVLNAIVSAVGRLGPATTSRRPDEGDVDIHLSVGGLPSRADSAGDVHPRWRSLEPLAVGDVITVRVLEADAADPPAFEMPAAGRAGPASGDPPGPD